MDIYPVQNFGAVCDGVTDDRAAVQVAINAAVTAGGGVVTANGETVALGATLDAGGNLAEIWLNQYRMRYSLLVNANDVTLEDINFVLPVAPTTPTLGLDNYSMLVFGDGQSTNTPYETMQRRYNVGVRRVNIDVSALSDAELLAMGEGSICGAIAFGKCDSFIVEDVNVDGSWGFTGVITAHVGSEYGVIRRVNINGRAVPGANGSYSPIGNGIWLDGVKHVQVTDCAINKVRNGITVATNRDNNRAPYAVTVSHNAIENFNGTGASIHGTKSIITDNVFKTDRGSAFGVVLFASQGWSSEGDLITGNTFEFVHPSGTLKSGVGFEVRSRGSATPEINRDHMIARNTVKNAVALVRFDSPSCTGNVIVNNECINSGGVICINDGTLDGNIIA